MYFTHFPDKSRMHIAKPLSVDKDLGGKVVATSFLCLTAHRRIAGDVPIYLKFALKVTHPRQKTLISTDFA